MKYTEWPIQWLEYYVKPIVKERTHLKYRRQMINHVIPYLGKYELTELTAQVLAKFTLELTNKNLATNTINSIISVLKSSLKSAVLLGVINVQYSDLIVRPKVKEKKIDCFSKQEQTIIEKYILSSHKPKLFGIVICLYTGLRIGELLALKWEDIDFSKGIVVISKSCHDSWSMGKYVKVVDTPKTDNSYRIIPLPKQMIARLQEFKKKSNSEYVVKGRSAYGVQVRSYQKTFEQLLIHNKIKHKGFHALRHTFATRALEIGMDVKTLSELLGHSNPSVTLKRYAHSMLEHKIEMMNKLGKLLL